MYLILRWNYPQGYKSLFLVKFLGNFCFYGLRSILILYMTSEFLLTDQKAFTFYGTFMALAYLTPVLGGWLSDQVLGMRKAVLIGGTIVFGGCLLLSIPHETLHFLGLSFVSVGVGFFKPNALTAVGHLFPLKTSKMKDSAYTTLYVGMNMGSFIGPLFCGWIGVLYGWQVVFPFLGLSIFLASWIFHHTVKNHPLFKETEPKSLNPLISYVGIFLMIPLVFMVLIYAPQMAWLMPIIILASMGCLGIVFVKSKGQERRDVLKIGLLMILFALFCSVFEQTGSSITLFIDRAVDRTLFNYFTIPTPFFQSLNPALVISFGPLIAGLWSQFELKNKSVGIFGKFAIGFLFIGLSFVILSLGIKEDSPTLLSPLWIIFVFFFQIVGEICIVPIGFSAVSTLAPKKFASMIMGLWMVSIACGNYLAALLANLSSLFGQTEENLMLSLATYKNFFLQISFIPLVIALLMGGGILFVKYAKQRS